MAQTTTHINASDVNLWLEDDGGVLRDISGSSNYVDLAFSRAMETLRTESAEWVNRQGTDMDLAVTLRAVYSTAGDEAFDILKNWYFANDGTRSFHVYPSTDHFYGKFILKSLSWPTSADVASPIPVTALFLLADGRLPMDFFDEFDRDDGALGNGWIDTTWTISGEEAVNSPNLGAELLTDPGLEANYTAGQCDTLTKGGAPTLNQSADVHGGAKAQEFTGTAFNDRLNWPIVAGVTGQWFQSSLWGKRTAGTSSNCKFRLYQNTLEPIGVIDRNIESAAYAQMAQVVRTDGTGWIFVYPQDEQGAAAFDTTLADDGSLKALTTDELFAVRPPFSPDAILKAGCNLTDGVVGIIARLDDASNPQNFIIGYILRHSHYYYAAVDKCVGGTYSTVIAATFMALYSAYNTGDMLEIRCDGTDVELWYDGAQIGATQTVNDAGIVSNSIHGMFAAGGSTIESFFMTQELIDMAVSFTGSSITQSIVGYAPKTEKWLKQNEPGYQFTFSNVAVSGWSTWPNLVNLADLTATTPNLVIWDTANDDSSDTDAATVEAFLRKVWAADPTTRIITMKFFGVADPAVNANVNSPTNELAMSKMQTVMDHYGVQVVDFWEEVRDLVNNQGRDLDEYLADVIHPTQLGYELARDLLTPYLPLEGQAQPYTLPGRIFDNGDYEETPVIKNGTDFDARTGVWVDTGTRTETVQVGATITYSGTFRSFGNYRADLGANDVEIDVNGAGYAAMAFYPNGLDLGSRQAYTLVIKNMAGTLRIDEFWAI